MWPLGLVIDVFPGNGEVVQIDKFRTGNSKTTIRPIVKLSSLPLC